MEPNLENNPKRVVHISSVQWLLVFVVLLSVAFGFKTVEVESTAKASIAAVQTSVQEQIDKLAEDLTSAREKQEDLQDATINLKLNVDALLLSMDKIQSRMEEYEESSSVPDGTFDWAKLKGPSFETACAIASSPDTPEEALVYLTSKLEDFIGSGKEYETFCAIILSNENASSAVLTGLLVNSTPGSLPLLASSKLHDELSLYLLAAEIRQYSHSSTYTRELALAVTNVLRNPALTKEALAELEQIENSAIVDALVHSKLYKRP